MEFARAQLLKYGWKEGKGLGRHETGIAEALKPKLKFDTTGVGHDGSEQFTYNWWEHAFNKAAKNVKIHSNENGVMMQADEELDITTKKYSVLAMKKKKNLEYGTFLKTSTLTNEGRTVDLAKEEDEDEEGEKNCITENATSITDEELFRICGGRTAHKGARHGLKLNGKLARIEAHELQLLGTDSEKETQNEGQINNATTSFSVVKKQKKNKKTKRKEQAKLEMATDADSGSPTHEVTKKKKKKKKRKVDETDIVLCAEETSEVVTDASNKKKKRKRNNSEVEEDRYNGQHCVESVVTGNSKKKKHKKKQKM